MRIITKTKYDKDPSTRSFLKDLTTSNISAGMISGTLAIAGPPVIILEAAAAGNFTYEQTISWIFSVYFFGALFGIILSMYYRMPIVGAHSITGVAFLVMVTPQFSYSELIGGYILSGIIIFLVGVTSFFTKIMSWIPKEIVSAMLAGIIATYVVRLIPALQDMPIVGFSALFVFFMLKKWDIRIPPVLGAVATALIVLLITHDIQAYSLGTSYVMPTIQIPEFSLLGAISISIPLALLILSNDATPGIGAVEQNGFKAPTNRIVSFSGIFSAIAGLFGGQSANVAGLMSAICSDDDAGKKEKRYMASIISSILILIFAIMAWKLVPFIQELPESFTSMLAAFVLIGVLSSSLKMGFSNRHYDLSVIFAFLISLSGVSFLYLSSPVWALIVGTIIAKTTEKEK
ncbi:benzoate/H(+) symporter BenE family transporter [Salicibibacter cibarius]|uniref:Benzoate/H(+) symporter BenE family transporter n=1 Tax=Salicibibacter cibarius TaxID=2743000 RepID=A0A7T7CAB9_9BACI|nr:benzoate/H(+) symporter BenE family transporter [Salicibibacter cibarius]QQK74729.1 benzoate/H(+) symporter BenE family transporter [Salicibibacter cibarius]